ncbi:tetratricopeptide repeat protein [uncultured Clostridium sp.]|jgi:tetratricopeptide (TPR) repeat protein|uniref:tetratricopeptide repeat protein n=1 Tax=uncultured Clostridium sp. TaxID=59620 RepID=UPI00261BD79D|nr:tetratricopeptide repeat protein [uncultured Clostridium sp.]
MNISNKKLKKALEHYKNGEYDSALKICEKFLEKEYSNEEALALEGDILYKLGRIDDAIVTWKINSEYNNNEEATLRLASVDKERKELALSYTSIQNMSSEDRILLENAYRENIELKKQVDNSDLLNANGKSPKESISNSNTEIETLVEISEPNIQTDIDFESHTTPISEHIDDFQNEIKPISESEEPVLNIEEPKEYHVIETNIDDIIESAPSTSNEPEAVDLEEFKARIQHLEDSSEPKDGVDDASNAQNTIKTAVNDLQQKKVSNHSKKKIIITTAAAIAIIIVAVSYSKLHSSKIPTDNSASLNQTKAVAPAKKDITKPADTTTAPKMLDATQAKQFVSDMQYLISADSIDGINNVLISTPKSSIPQSAMAEYEKAETFMKTTGLTYYNDNGMAAYKNGDYSTAIDYFKKAKPYAKDDFRGPTMLFLTAVSYEKNADMTNAITTYKDFLATYPDAPNYGPESLYFLANYYSKNNNPTEAKQYANTLVTKYPSSMYNNDTIKTILK